MRVHQMASEVNCVNKTIIFMLKKKEIHYFGKFRMFKWCFCIHYYSVDRILFVFMYQALVIGNNHHYANYVMSML